VATTMENPFTFFTFFHSQNLESTTHGHATGSGVHRFWPAMLCTRIPSAMRPLTLMLAATRMQSTMLRTQILPLLGAASLLSCFDKITCALARRWGGTAMRSN
jgi:hypothetical protein